MSFASLDLLRGREDASLNYNTIRLGLCIFITGTVSNTALDLTADVHKILTYCFFSSCSNAHFDGVEWNSNKNFISIPHLRWLSGFP